MRIGLSDRDTGKKENNSRLHRFGFRHLGLDPDWPALTVVGFSGHCCRPFRSCSRGRCSKRLTQEDEMLSLPHCDNQQRCFLFLRVSAVWLIEPLVTFNFFSFVFFSFRTFHVHKRVPCIWPREETVKSKASAVTVPGLAHSQ